MKNLLFIGLGNMGNPMAENLISARGFNVSVYDLDERRGDNLIALGGYWAKDLPRCLQQSDIVMTSLPGPVQVEQLAFAAGGIFDNLPAGTAWIELSTNNLDVCRKLVDTALAKGVDFLDAPVSGGDEGAQSGSLTILVGGNQAVFDRYLPVLEIIGDNITLLGSSGAGYSAKIAQVVLCYVHSLALSEAMMLGVKGGVDPRQMLSVIQNSTGRSYVSDRYGPPILNGDYDPSFTVGLSHKDMQSAMDMAKNLGIELPLCELTTQIYRESIEAFGFDANHLKAVRLLEEKNSAFLQAGNSE